MIKKHVVLKTLIASLLLAAGLVPAAAVHAASASAVLLSSPDTVMPGEQFTVEVIVQPDTSVAGCQFDLSFDPSLVTVNSVTEGPFLSQDGAATFFLAGTIDNPNGIVDGTAGAIITRGMTVSGPGTFAVITMTAGNTRGDFDLTLSNVVVASANGEPVPVDLYGSHITIGSNQAPSLAPLGDQTGSKGNLLSFTVSASDPDGDALTYSVSNLPKGASFDSSSGTFTWMPRGNQDGVYSGISFTVSDGALSDSESITITIGSASGDTGDTTHPGKGKKPSKN